MELVVHRMERRTQVVSLRARAATHLRQEMDERGLTAKELSRLIRDKTPYRLDYRTIQNAMLGSMSLDTYEALVGAFGWDWADRTIEPVIGASRLAALEHEYEQQRAHMASLDREIAAHRAARLARGSVDGGRLRLVPPEVREFGA
jgi:hypothetical protein